MNSINDLHIFSWKQHVVLPETVLESPLSLLQVMSISVSVCKHTAQSV